MKLEIPDCVCYNYLYYFFWCSCRSKNEL